MPYESRKILPFFKPELRNKITKAKLYIDPSFIPLSHSTFERTAVYPDSAEKISIYERLKSFFEGITVPLKTNKPIQLSIRVDRRVDGLGYSREFGKRVYLDTPQGVALVDAENPESPLAVIGFRVDNDELIVRQIQGVKGQYEKLKKMGRWEKILVRLAEDAAKALGISKIGIITAQKNGWVRNRTRLGLMDGKAAQLRYDGTAKRMGYKWDEKEQTWFKDIK